MDMGRLMYHMPVDEDVVLFQTEEVNGGERGEGRGGQGRWLTTAEEGEERVIQENKLEKVKR